MIGPDLPPRPWRLLPTIETDGQTQMAIDRAILQSVQSGQSLPTLRFYTWKPAAISLGYHQRTYPDHWKTLTWNDRPLDIVTRPTGGRAVLHQGDLTYAVIAAGFSSKRTESYQQICQFLIQGWRSLSIDLSYGKAGRGNIQNPNCFGTATDADLILPNGTKFIGSAQKRSGDVTLQQGSMRIRPDFDLLEQVFGPSPLGLPDISMPNILTTLPLERITKALTQSATECFSAQFVEAPLSTHEHWALSQL